MKYLDTKMGSNMRLPRAFAGFTFAALLLVNSTSAKPDKPEVVFVNDDVYADRVGDLSGTAPAASKTSQDTVWVADWTFDSPGGTCDDTGWTKVDNRVRNDGQTYWNADDSRFDGTGGISGQAAVLAEHDLCWPFPDGYDNDWYQALVIEYSGTSSLSFDYLLDSETNYDFIRVEVDSACSSHDRVDFDLDPLFRNNAARLRGAPLFEASGLDVSGRVENVELTDFGQPGETHCAYIAFFSDAGWSQADGLQPTTLGIALAVDNVQLTGGNALAEDFEAVGTMHPALSFANIQDKKPFGNWARLYEHITDNDFCTENTTCAWLFTDDTNPSVAAAPSAAFGPGAYVIRQWIDESIVSPWVSVADVPSTAEMFLKFQEFPGNSFATSRLVRMWRVRGKSPVDNTDTATPGDSVDCISFWGAGSPRANSLSTYRWMSRAFDITALSVSNSTRILQPALSHEIQVSFRVQDWQGIFGPPSPVQPGPGPYIDRVRIGYLPKSGPTFKSEPVDHHLAQDAFPTEIHPLISGPGEHHRPTTDRFGTAAFSQAYDIGRTSGIHFNFHTSPNVITGDSISVEVVDPSGNPASVTFYGAIVSGPHAGKAPPPWTVGANGFFVVPTDNERHPITGQIIQDRWFADLDDDYFRGGDVLHYLWVAEGTGTGISSYPAGLSGIPSSVEEAEASTGGLFEVSFLPTIDWDPGYLARVAADPNGKLEPTQSEVENSVQKNCILYYGFLNSGRRTGDANRTSFMYTLDRLGYRGHYDVYDRVGLADNQDLAGRATVEQASGYALIIQDNGNLNHPWPLPDGSDFDQQKVDQAGWYREWLARAGASEAATATLWLIGSRVTETAASNPLVASDMGVDIVSQDILPQLGANPDVEGQATFTFANGITQDFNDDFTLQAACPTFPPYNGIGARGSATVTHRWSGGSGFGDAAIVMNANSSQSWNTIMQVPTWREIRDVNESPTAPGPEEQLMAKVLLGVLPADCLQSQNPTDVGGDRDGLDGLPRVTALHQNAPNPFNPMTTIRFDLARSTHVDLRIYDVTGRLVRTLADSPMKRQRHQIVWNGLDDAGTSVASGIYFYRLKTADFGRTRKMVVLR